EMESAYKKLIAFYKSREDYASINTLLVNTDSEAIRTMFQHYMAAPPEFSYKEGTYAEVVPLKLTASTQGTIYYTMDGTIPDLNSEVYTSPIFLETGSYTISAMFVNEYGIESEVVAKSYVIDVLKPTAPEVETYSGEYTTPSMIRVLVPTGCTVYYTTDGQVPTDQSAIYVSEIPMPLGKSTFKFVTYSKEGVAGAVTTRHFDLKLATDFTADMAVSRLVEVMVENGRITDVSGTIAGDLNGRYLYNFQYALAIPNEGDFYVISEVYEDSAGVQNKTGTTYAVNAYTQEYYKLSRDALDGYILETF
ncbi:MAG: chitobiase/beta-hexosaminidase C-terminal domain-containing protein, partial [Lachnospiraceae bacterium]